MNPPIPQHRATTLIGENLFGAWELNLEAHVAHMRGDDQETIKQLDACEKRISAALIDLLELKKQLHANRKS